MYVLKSFFFKLKKCQNLPPKNIDLVIVWKCFWDVSFALLSLSLSLSPPIKPPSHYCVTHHMAQGWMMKHLFMDDEAPLHG